jgi:hypothetical protein
MECWVDVWCGSECHVVGLWVDVTSRHHYSASYCPTAACLIELLLHCITTQHFLKLTVSLAACYYAFGLMPHCQIFYWSFLEMRRNFREMELNFRGTERKYTLLDP